MVEGVYCGKQYMFDATRQLNQFERYINHSCLPNIKFTSVLKVRDKIQVGFISTKLISEGSQLFCDYGDIRSHLDWLKTKDPRKSC